VPYEKITFINQGPPGISADRLNHIQTQYDEAAADLAAHVAAPDPHPQYATDSDLATHLAEKVQAHGINDRDCLIWMGVV
jgi:hypothetical protein